MNNKSRKLKIGVDLDNVLADFMSSFIKFYNHKYKTIFVKENFTHYDLHKTLGGDLDRGIKICHDFYGSDDFRDIIPIEGSQEIVNRLADKNDLFIITSRPHDIEKETNEWIEKYFSNIFSDIILTNSYSLNNLNKKSKSQLCEYLGIDVFIDDSFDFISECLSPKRRSFLFTQPWNKNSELLDGMERVESWRDILEKLEGNKN